MAGTLRTVSLYKITLKMSPKFKVGTSFLMSAVPELLDGIVSFQTVSHINNVTVNCNNTKQSKEYLCKIKVLMRPVTKEVPQDINCFPLVLTEEHKSSLVSGSK